MFKYPISYGSADCYNFRLFRGYPGNAARRSLLGLTTVRIFDSGAPFSVRKWSSGGEYLYYKGTNTKFAYIKPPPTVLGEDGDPLPFSLAVSPLSASRAPLTRPTVPSARHR